MKTCRFLIPIVVAVAAGLAGAGRVAAQGGGPAVNRWVISSGGAPASGSGVTLNDTLGQPVIGSSSNGGAGLSAGYWAGCIAAAAAAPAVTAARDGADVVLTWAANSNNVQYQVWISADPFFAPDRPGSVTPVLWPASPYRHAGAAISPSNYFYVVRGLNACDAVSPNSGRTGKFTFGLTPGN
jgi:hypothetical protein